MFYWHSTFLNFFVNDKVFQLHMLSTFGILVVFRKEDCCGIITINFQRLGNIVDYSKSWNKVSQPISLKCGLKACHKFSFHGGCNNDSLLHTFPWNRSSGQKIHITKCRLSCIHTADKVWICITYHLKVIIFSISKHVILCSL